MRRRRNSIPGVDLTNLTVKDGRIIRDKKAFARHVRKTIEMLEKLHDEQANGNASEQPDADAKR